MGRPVLKQYSLSGQTESVVGHPEWPQNPCIDVCSSL